MRLLSLSAIFLCLTSLAAQPEQRGVLNGLATVRFSGRIIAPAFPNRNATFSFRIAAFGRGNNVLRVRVQRLTAQNRWVDVTDQVEIPVGQGRVLRANVAAGTTSTFRLRLSRRLFTRGIEWRLGTVRR